MTTLKNRPNTALLVIDVQNDVVEGAYERDAVVDNIGRLVDQARKEDVPIIWVQHSDEELERGSDPWRIVPELSPDDREPLVEKNYGDSFEDTNLEDVLSGLGVGRLVVCGAADRRVYPLDAPRGNREGLRRHARQRRTHHCGPYEMGRAVSGHGHRSHQPLLEIPERARTLWRDRRNERRGLQRHLIAKRLAAPGGRHGRTSSAGQRSQRATSHSTRPNVT